ncbi:uncharacterized protein B0I36DRAFT_370609 [Microdochium trichocladiopsis]|uniref:ubiquitinyl hydrolase 1 n=1 Tax=Microdochium trichocladiopsis TaxID=1682393 RepID=A0A9P8XNY0_9PEZI|nr:uncharacterized protein B0I36DRAFT_370609 [Microdochium trichocladiopsis]KAH7007900.1 hypothetical protein B0I36DRAFT_370609 [Microdochium trichocladiopsis]
MLGCLRDGGALAGKLFLCHLHALTTHCLPDKLTGRTGTEEALRILGSAAVQSDGHLQEEDLDLLHRIGCISPVRDRRAVIEWSSSAPPAAQSDAFCQLVAATLGRAKLSQLCLSSSSFSSSSDQKGKVFRNLPRSYEPLVRRAVARASAYCVSQYGATQHLAATPDDKYTGPGGWAEKYGEFEAFRLARHMIHSKDQAVLLHPVRPLGEGRKFFHTCPGDASASAHVPTRVEFNMGWLVNPSTVPASTWFRVLQELGLMRRSGSGSADRRYGEVLFLAGLLFAPSARPELVQLLLTVATAPTTTSEPGGSAGNLAAGIDRHLLGLDDGLDVLELLAALTSDVSSLPVSSDQSGQSPVKRAPFSTHSAPRGFVSVEDLFKQPPPPPPIRPSPPEMSRERVKHETCDKRPMHPELLRRLLQDLRGMFRLEHEHKYAEELSRGIDALQDSGTETLARLPGLPTEGGGGIRGLLEHMDTCRRDVADRFATIHAAVQGATPEGLLAVSPMLLLERLSRRHRAKLPDGWLRCLVDYAVSITALQRAERLVRAADSGRKLARELLNVGHENWDPIAFPDWLLLEVEMGILIRPVQKRVALAMMQPPGKRNCVMQLNMGEGKSSVIVPMVASALADGSRLVRVIVARPQSKQMTHTLVRALGGLLDCRICQLSFSRDFRHEGSNACRLAGMRAQCVEYLETGGIMVAQPEHILSLKLSGVEAALLPCNRSEAAKTAKALLDLQHLFDTRSRDVVDESDEILSITSELSYAMGLEAAIDLGPLRWRLIQSVLKLVAEIAPAIRREHPDKLEVSPELEGRFPRIRILNEAGAAVLADRLVQRICDEGLAGFAHIVGQKQHVREAALRYIHQLEPSASDVALKRWRVNYGRASNRSPPTRLAVPFHAKDLPTPRSEFSHPDVVIILTCLSYYYGGLSDDELFGLIERLLLSVGGERVYLSWVQSAPNGIPSAFRQLDTINIRDRQQCADEVFPHLRYLRSVINYYLTNTLFAREMRESSQKLSESSWSIAKAKPQPTTGFSGTNDVKCLLPLSIESLDLGEQRHTNALVLNHLLRPENTVRDVFPAAEPPGPLDHGPSPDLELLRRIAGRCSLAMIPAADASAAVFSDNDEDMCVVTRDGTAEPFLTSLYAANTASCLIFLDEAHTRGTDLRLPDDYRAAVTLGPALTKDRLVQGPSPCMRMRELGQGQSVTFFVSAEIRRKITTLRGMPKDGDIGVGDVLAWSISETWHESQRLMPLWAVLGLRHQHQKLLWDQADTGAGYNLSREAAVQFLEIEALSLRDRYSPDHGGQTRRDLDRAIAAAAPDAQRSEVARIRERCEAFGASGPQRTSALEEEQERELLVERGKDRPEAPAQPMPVKPLTPSLHKDVEAFIVAGTVRHNSAAFMPAFDALARSSVARFSRDLRLPPGLLLVTADFARTVDLPAATGCVSDAYQRPVQWIATTPTRSKCGVTAVVLSPWEANALMPAIRAGGTAATLHLFAPRTSLATRSAEDLLLYATPAPPPAWRAPRTLVLTLLLFAGQLYLRTYHDYVDMCRFLGVPYRAGSEEEEGEEKDQTRDGERCVFGPTAVPFFLGLIGRIRHPCADISTTDIGHILAGDMLPPTAFSGPDLDGTIGGLIADGHRCLGSDNPETHTECVTDNVSSAFQPLAAFKANNRWAILSEAGDGKHRLNSDVFLAYAGKVCGFL